jgi:hypothetical protein
MGAPDTFRDGLVSGVADSDFKWAKISLAGGATVEVSHPLFLKDVYVPVTAKEAWTLAAKFKWYPLTRAVADQAHNQAVAKGTSVTGVGWPTLSDYKGFSKSLEAGLYGTKRGSTDAVVSGAHKYWLLSTGPHGVFGADVGKHKKGDPIPPPVDKKAINYGFYKPTTTKSYSVGKYLDPKWTVIQGLGGAHDSGHWDYSQLLQFMRNYENGSDTDLGAAILAGNPAVWDETPFKLTKDVLPF